MKKTLAVAAALFAQAALAQQPLPTGYTCCNLHYDKDKISDINWTHAAMIPLGTPIRVKSMGSASADVEIDGKPYAIVQDYTKAQEPIQSLIGKLVVPTNPRDKIGGWPEPVRAAVQ